MVFNRYLFSFLFAFGFMVYSQAQRFAYIDTRVVLEKYPPYKQAEQRLNNQVENWQKEIEEKEKSYQKAWQSFLNEKVLLTPDQIKTREAAFQVEQEEIKSLQIKRFGPEGDVITLRKQLVKPLQDKIWKTVEILAKQKKYSFIFDKGSDLIMLYTDPTYDLTRDVIRALGIR